MRWDDALDGYWLARRRNLSTHTIEDYARTYRRFGLFVRNAEVKQITAAQVNAFLNYLSEEMELGPKTVLNAWIALSSFWSWAHDELGLPHVVSEGVDKPKAKSPPGLPYSEEEVRKLLDACVHMNAWSRRTNKHVDGRRPSKLRDQAIMLTLLDTGLRVSEMCALKIRDYDRKQGRLVVEHGKGDKPRIVYLGTAGQRALWRYLSARTPSPNEPLFATSTGRHMDKDSVRLMISRAGDRAGIQGAAPHRFRHTFAINFLRNGGNILALQDLLGHSSMEMVRRYARQAEVDLQQAQRRASPADNWGL
jgi:integrase/recombinase XerD